MRYRKLALPALCLSLSLVACGAPNVPGNAPSANPSATTPAAAATPTAKPTTEVEGPQPRLAVTYDGGILVLDGTKLTQLADIKAEGFLRLNGAGDGRRLLVTQADQFRLLDLGAWTRAHGDHGHSYVTQPELTTVSFPGSHPGHVVHNGDTVTLFYDGTGTYQVYNPSLLGNSHAPKTTNYSTAAAHHGVALVLHDGSRLETIGTDKARVGARVVNAQGKEIVRAENCPGVHGEGMAAKDRVVLGCTDGALIFDGSKFIKVSAPAPYARIGNVAATLASPIVLGDYKTDKDAKLERPKQVSLIDTTTGALRLVDLPASYSFRSLGRGPGAEALVLGDDGNLRVIDPASGKIVHTVPVTKEWTEPEKWQQPRPTLRVLGDKAYVSDPATKQIHVVDAKTWKVVHSATLAQTPNEIEGVLG